MAVPSAADWIAGLGSGRVTWGRDWHEIAPRCFVPSLPLRLDGVFWPVTAADLQRLADGWSPLARLLTPTTADLVRDQAAVRLDFAADESSGRPDMGSEAAARRYSAALDRALRARGIDPDGSAPLCCLGAKDWTLTRDLELGRSTVTGRPLPPRAACNYGAFHPSGGPSVSGRWRVIQSPGYVHNQDHRDYSQLARLVFVERGGAQPARDGCTLTRLPGVPAPGAQGGELAALGLLALGLGFG